MARKGIRKVETIRHGKLGIDVSLMLDMETMTFTAEYRGRRFRDKDGDKLRDELLAYIEQENVITWQRVIEVKDVSSLVTRGDEDGIGGRRQIGVGFELRRYWLGLAASGRILQSPWDVPEARRFDLAVELRLRPRATPEHEARVRDRSRGFVDEAMPPRASEVTLPWREATPRFRDWTPRTILAYTDDLWHGVNAIADVIERERQQLAALVGDTDKFDLVAKLGAAAMAKLLPAPAQDEG